VERVVVVGAGKAGAPMAAAAEAVLGDLPGWRGGVVIVKEGHTEPRPAIIDLIEAGHPLPDARGVAGTEQILARLGGLGPRDLVLALISGGGSALLADPAPPVTLADLQAVTGLLLKAGATIGELNTVRKHLARLKGGGLAAATAPAPLVALILSDVVGSPLDIIASGPTVPDPATFADAWAVIMDRSLADRLPPAVRARLEAGRRGEIPDTPGPDDPRFAQVTNVIVGDNRLAAQAAVERARALGLHALLLSTYIEGEAREVGRVVAGLAKELAATGMPLPRPACLVLGGETTVTVRGPGRGGRNQELALAAALALDGWSEGVAVATLATDGGDGTGDAAGAVATGATVARARALGLDPAAALTANDSYTFWHALGDGIVTGPTGTNVNDLTFVIVL
jgi:hydroxypyruvate reductase